MMLLKYLWEWYYWPLEGYTADLFEWDMEVGWGSFQFAGHFFRQCCWPLGTLWSMTLLWRLTLSRAYFTNLMLSHCCFNFESQLEFPNNLSPMSDLILAPNHLQPQTLYSYFHYCGSYWYISAAVTSQFLSFEPAYCHQEYKTYDIKYTLKR